jgi:hypothetical protein
VTYHFDVRLPDDVGFTDHDYLDASGSVTSSISPRMDAEEDTKAHLLIRVRDASGTPLAGAAVRLSSDPSGQPHTSERAAPGGRRRPGASGACSLLLIPVADGRA